MYYFFTTALEGGEEVWYNCAFIGVTRVIYLTITKGKNNVKVVHVSVRAIM